MATTWTENPITDTTYYDLLELVEYFLVSEPDVYIVWQDAIDSCIIYQSNTGFDQTIWTEIPLEST
jgi:hypothetical protein